MKKRRDANYRTMFFAGIVLMAIGFSLQMVALWSPGILFFILGAARRDQWPGKKEDAGNDQTE